MGTDDGDKKKKGRGGRFGKGTGGLTFEPPAGADSRNVDVGFAPDLSPIAASSPRDKKSNDAAGRSEVSGWNARAPRGGPSTSSSDDGQQNQDEQDRLNPVARMLAGMPQRQDQRSLVDEVQDMLREQFSAKPSVRGAIQLPERMGAEDTGVRKDIRLLGDGKPPREDADATESNVREESENAVEYEEASPPVDDKKSQPRREKRVVVDVEIVPVEDVPLVEPWTPQSDRAASLELDMGEVAEARSAAEAAPDSSSSKAKSAAPKSPASRAAKKPAPAPTLSDDDKARKDADADADAIKRALAVSAATTANTASSFRDATKPFTPLPLQDRHHPQPVPGDNKSSTLLAFPAMSGFDLIGDIPATPPSAKNESVGESASDRLSGANAQPKSSQSDDVKETASKGGAATRSAESYSLSRRAISKILAGESPSPWTPSNIATASAAPANAAPVDGAKAQAAETVAVRSSSPDSATDKRSPADATTDKQPLADAASDKRSLADAATDQKTSVKPLPTPVMTPLPTPDEKSKAAEAAAVKAAVEAAAVDAAATQAAAAEAAAAEAAAATSTKPATKAKKKTRKTSTTKARKASATPKPLSGEEPEKKPKKEKTKTRRAKAASKSFDDKTDENAFALPPQTPAPISLLDNAPVDHSEVDVAFASMEDLPSAEIPAATIEEFEARPTAGLAPRAISIPDLPAVSIPTSLDAVETKKNLAPFSIGPSVMRRPAEVATPKGVAVFGASESGVASQGKLESLVDTMLVGRNNVADRDDGELHLQFKDDVLRGLFVSLVREEGAFVAKFVVADATVRRQIDGHAQSLVDRLCAKGMNVTGYRVEVRDGGDAPARNTSLDDDGFDPL